jgi:hypothetical protein
MQTLASAPCRSQPQAIAAQCSGALRILAVLVADGRQSDASREKGRTVEIRRSAKRPGRFALGAIQSMVYVIRL